MIFHYMDSIPFQITQNKFFVINEKLFAPYTEVKQFTSSPEPQKQKDPFVGLMFLGSRIKTLTNF